MNQGKLDTVKHEMARVNNDILAIGELIWTRMGEFNLDNHHVYYHGQEIFGRNGVSFIINKSVKCSTWVQSQKQQIDLCLFPRKTIHYHSNPSLFTNHWCWRSWSWPVLWRITRPSRTNTKKDVLFITGNWNAQVGSQEIPGVAGKFGIEYKMKQGKG